MADSVVTRTAVKQQRREADLDVSPDVRSRELEYAEDGAGRTTYRHVITTAWQVLPSE